MKKIFFSSVIIVVVGVFAAVVLLSQSARVPRWVAARLSRLTGTEVRINAVSLTLFPLPRLTLSGVSCGAGTLATIHAETVSFSASPIALVQQSTLPARIVFERPIVNIHLKKMLPPSRNPYTSLQMQQQLIKAITVAAQRYANMSAEIRNGVLTLHGEDGMGISFSNLCAEATVARNGVRFRASVDSEFWKSVHLDATLTEQSTMHDTSTVRAQIAVQVTECNLREFPKLLAFLALPEKAVQSMSAWLPADARPSFFATAGVGLPMIEPWHTALNVQATVQEFGFHVPQAHCDVLALGGTVTLQDGRLSITNWSGRIGASSLNNVNAVLNFRQQDRIDVDIQGATIVLDDAAKILVPVGDIWPAADVVKSGTGRIIIDRAAFSGQLVQPSQWSLTLNGTINNATFAVPGEHEALTISRGNIKITEDTASITDAHIAFLDTQLVGSFVAPGYRTGMHCLKAKLSGRIGAASLEKLYLRGNLPSWYALRAPVTIHRANIIWESDGRTEITANASFASATQVAAAVRTEGKTIQMCTVRINDTDSRCVVRLSSQGGIYDLAWQGRLRRPTLDKIFAENRFLTGEITGDVTVRLNKKDYYQSLAHGTLRVLDAGYHAFSPVPLTVAEAVCNAQGNKVRLDAHGVRFGTNAADITGTISISADGFVVDGTISSQRLCLDEFGQFDAAQGSTPRMEQVVFGGMPLRGRLNVAIQELSRDKVLLSPCHADILFLEREIQIRATDVKLCGIELSGNANVRQDDIALQAVTTVQNASARHAIQCLFGETSLVTGKLDLRAELMAQGAVGRLLDDVQGSVDVVLKNGRIYKSNLLADIFSFLSIRNLLFDRRIDMGKKGLSYRRFDMKGDIHGGVLHIREALFDSNALTVVGQGTVSLTDRRLDLTVLATPFQIQDLVFMNLPVVGALFGKTLIGVPLKITGTVGDTKVVPGPPAASIQGLVGLARDIVKLPLHIVEPVIERANETMKK
ncbi:MAG: AsmA-like C-terminal domain-containing protein [Desulfobacterota bacterium]|nr:AsmA-like C-terminal domain-containing protein [Thermodesulfobacteriota bacterium]